MTFYSVSNSEYSLRCAPTKKEFRLKNWSLTREDPWSEELSSTYCLHTALYYILFYCCYRVRSERRSKSFTTVLRLLGDVNSIKIRFIAFLGIGFPFPIFFFLFIHLCPQKTSNQSLHFQWSFLAKKSLKFQVPQYTFVFVWLPVFHTGSWCKSLPQSWTPVAKPIFLESLWIELSNEV